MNKTLFLDSNTNFSKLEILSNKKNKPSLKKIENCIYKYSNVGKKDYSIFYIQNKEFCNVLFIEGIINAYKNLTRVIPHIICNSMEEPNIINFLNKEQDNGLIEVEYLQPNIYGCILSSKIESKIKPNRTCLMILSPINNYTGSINNIKKIGEIAHKNKVPLFSDCSSLFGRYELNINDRNIDSFSIQLPLISCLVIKNQLVQGYKLLDYCNILNYNKNNPLDENNTQAHINEIKNIYSNRLKKNKNFDSLKKYFIESFDQEKIFNYDHLKKNNYEPQKEDLILLGPNKNQASYSVPYILSFLYFTKKKTTNLFKVLQKHNIIVSKIPNIYLDNILINPEHQSKVLSIKLNDSITKKDLDRLIKIIKQY